MEAKRREEERRKEDERRRREAERRPRRRESPQRRLSQRSPHRPSSSRHSPSRRQRSPERKPSSSTSSRKRESSSSRRTSALERLGPKVPVTSRLGGGGRVSRKRRPGSKERYVARYVPSCIAGSHQQNWFVTKENNLKLENREGYHGNEAKQQECSSLTAALVLFSWELKNIFFAVQFTSLKLKWSLKNRKRETLNFHFP